MYDFSKYTLPKWPQMIITGDYVTVEQAKDIIFRTDGFLTDNSEYSGGNERNFNENYREMCGFVKTKDHYKEYEQMSKLREKLGFVELNYVHNTFASSSFIGGPYGFCHPDGTILYTHNIGKYPSVEEVYEDFVKIAQAWPFLNMKASLYSGESCEDGKCVVSFIIKDGSVELTEEDFKLKESVVCVDATDTFIANMNDSMGEIGLPLKWYDEFAAKVKKALQELD